MPTVYDEDQKIENSPSQVNESLYDRETKSESQNSDQAEKNSEPSSVNPESGLYKGSAKREGRSFGKKKSLAAGGIAAGGIAGLIFFFISLGPLQFMQFSNLLQAANFGDQDLSTRSRIRNLTVYSRLYLKGDTTGLENTRLGTIEAKSAGKIDKKLESNGLKSSFVDGKFTGFDIDYNNLPQTVRDDMKSLSNNKPEDTQKRKEILAKHYGIDPGDIEINGKASIPAQNVKNNRRILSSVMRTNPDIGRITSAMSKRALIKRANIGYNPVTRYTEEKRREFWKNLSERFTGDAGEVEARQRQAAADDANPPDDATKEAIDKANQGAADIENAAKKGDVFNLNKLLKGGGPLVVVAALCTVKEVSTEAEAVNQINKISAGIKSANLVLALGSKAQDGGDIDMATLGEYSKLLNNKKNGDWGSSDLVQYETSGRVTDTAQDRTLSNYSELNPENGSKAKLVTDLLEIQKALGMDAGLDAVCKIFSVVDSVTSGIINQLDFTGLIATIEAKISSLLMNWLAGGVPDLSQEQYHGKVFGEVAALGGRFMANEASATAGGRVLTSAEELVLSDQTTRYLADIDTRSPVQKISDLSDPKNPIGNMAVAVQSQNAAAIIAKLPGLLFLPLSNITNNRAGAEDTVDKQKLYYGIPKVGFTAEEFDGPKYEDPYSNAIWVKNNLTPESTVVKDFAECNNMVVSSNWDFTTKSYDDGGLLDYKEIKEVKCTQTSEAYTRLRILALDTSVLKSFSCFEFNDEQSCQEITGTSEAATAPPASTITPEAGGWVWPVKGDVSISSCFAQPLSKGLHPGLDIRAKYVPAYAVNSGEVFGTPGGSYGILKIKHDNGVYSIYEHMSEISVTKGERVTAGQQIGVTGNTAPAGGSSGPHLHFGMTKEVNYYSYSDMGSGYIINPLTFLNGGKDFKQCSAQPQTK